MRELDTAIGGGEVPAGAPLGGPVFKSNGQLNAERIEAEEQRAAEEKANAEATPPAPPLGPVPPTPPADPLS